MCGIGAILRITPPGQRHEPIPEAWLDALDAGIAWRGPDGAGRFRDRMTREDGAIVEVAMVHRRLAIIDIEGGAQPMVLERCPACESRLGIPQATELSRHHGGGGRRLAVVFNGCIYNARQLRAELESKGHVFSTDHSDTEVILHGWSEWGGHLRRRLEGMYAIAMWDGAYGELIAMRDRFGEKPLYLMEKERDRTWVLSSAAGSFPRPCFDERDFDDCGTLTNWISLGASRHPPIGGARALDLWEIRRIGPEIDMSTPELPNFGDYRSISESHFEQLLDNSVGARLDADVPLGCFLSGGIDSSLVALMASRRTSRLTTLTVRMPNDRYDESHYAQVVAEHLGTNHVTLECDADRAAEDLLALVRAMGLPFGDSSLLPTYWLCREARKHVKVALAGDGGDELFLGYDRFRAVPLLRRWGWLLRLIPRWALNTEDPKSTASRLSRLSEAARGEGFPELEAVFGYDTRRRIFPEPEYWSLGRPWIEEATVEVARRLTLVSYLPSDLLRKVDTASMLAGVEVRCPMLDSSLVDAALQVSPEDHMRNGEGKHIIKQIARKYLPPEVVDRPKQGFAIPISDWWRTDFGGLGTLMMERLSKDRPFGIVHDALEIDVGYVRQMIDEHWAAGGLAPRFTTRIVRPRDHGQRLFALLTLALWSDSLG